MNNINERNELDKIEIWDLNNSNVCIKIKNPLREEFFMCLLKLTGGYRKLGERVGLTLGHVYDLKKGKYFISLKLINKFLNICPENIKLHFKHKIETNIEKIKIRSRSTSIINPKFPIQYSSILARIAGHLVGDGGINNTLIVHYTNTNSYLLEEFRKDISKTFRNVKNGEYSHSSKDHVKTVWFPRIIGLLLTKMFGKQLRKSKHIPKIIIGSDNISKAIFLRALFDDEGSVNIESYTIALEMTGRNLIRNIKNLLKEFGINAGKIAKIKRKDDKWKGKYQIQTKYKFYISGKINLERFYKLINFNHPEKKTKLKVLIQKYK